MYDTGRQINSDTKGHAIRQAGGRMQVYIGAGSWSTSTAAAVDMTFREYALDDVSDNDRVYFVPLAKQ